MATPPPNNYFANSSGTYNGFTLNHVGGHQHNNQGNMGRIIENEGTYNENNNTGNKQALPQELEAACDEYFKPAVIELAGCSEDAWKEPASGDLIKIWAKFMPNDKKGQFSPFEQGIKNWVTGVLADWRNSIGDAALEALESIFVDQKLESTEQIRDYVKQQTNGQYWVRPYFFQDTQQSNEQKSNPFQSYIIARTFSVHFKAIQDIPEDHLSERPPSEALSVTILAIERAFELYSTGERSATHQDFSQSSQRIKPNRIRLLFGKNKEGADLVSRDLWTQIVTSAKSHIEASIKDNTNTTPEDDSEGLPGGFHY